MPVSPPSSESLPPFPAGEVTARLDDVQDDDANWDLVIRSQRRLLHFHWRDLWAYRDLLYMFVRSDVVTVYKQTILGPIWFLAQPLMTMLVFLLIFGRIADLPTDGIPRPVFYLAGIIVWNFFAESFSRTAVTYTAYAHIFTKVYFPRLIVPLSLVTSSLLKFLIQFLLFLSFYAYACLTSDLIQPNLSVLMLPYLLLLTGGLGMGFGILFSSLTTKYRDLVFLLQFGIQLAMYVTPIIYPLSMLDESLRKLFWWNPLSHIVEMFRFAFTGEGIVSPLGLVYSSVFALTVILAGVVVFDRAGRNFVDNI